MMRRSRWGARTHVNALPRSAAAADKFFRRLASFPFGERRDRGGNAVGDPVVEAGLRIGHDQRKTGSTGRYIRPGERGRHVFADAIRIGFVVAGHSLWQQLAILES